MQVQMIELEEVQMIEVGDEALEAINSGATFTVTLNGCHY